MSVVAEGGMSLSIESMRLAVASSETYREVTSSADETQAIGTVIVGGVWEETPPEKARSIVRIDEGMSFEQQSNTTFSWTIQFIVTFEVPIPKQHHSVFADAYTWFMNRDGAFLLEILNNCRLRPGELPNIVRGGHLIRPGIYDPDEKQGEYIGVSEYQFEAMGEIHL